MNAPESSAPVQPRCPVCDAPLADEQNWCLECGAAARTRIAPTPRWRVATAVTVAAVVLALTAIGFAIDRLVGGSSRSTTVTTQTVTAPTTTPPAAATGASGATAGTGASGPSGAVTPRAKK